MRKNLFAAAFVLVAMFACSNNNNATAPTAAPTTKPAASAMAVLPTVKVANSDKGKILTDAAGRTLYTFDRDSAGKSACVDTCAQTWPALTFSEAGTPTGASGLGTITRTDGKKQVTHNGKPLYIYSGDTKPGDTNGDGFGGIWHVAKP